MAQLLQQCREVLVEITVIALMSTCRLRGAAREIEIKTCQVTVAVDAASRGCSLGFGVVDTSFRHCEVATPSSHARSDTQRILF